MLKLLEAAQEIQWVYFLFAPALSNKCSYVLPCLLYSHGESAGNSLQPYVARGLNPAMLPGELATPYDSTLPGPCYRPGRRSIVWRLAVLIAVATHVPSSPASTRGVFVCLYEVLKLRNDQSRLRLCGVALDVLESDYVMESCDCNTTHFRG